MNLFLDGLRVLVDICLVRDYSAVLKEDAAMRAVNNVRKPHIYALKTYASHADFVLCRYAYALTVGQSKRFHDDMMTNKLEVLLDQEKELDDKE